MEAAPDALVSSTSSNPSVVVRAAKDIAFGSIAGMTAKVFEHPFDLAKVRLQSQVLDSTARFSGPIDCLMQTWRKEGVRGLYRGLPAPIVGAMAENASLFLAYSELKNAVRWSTAQSSDQQLSLNQIALASAGAGAITSFFLTPIELVKCKMQVQMLLPPPISTLSDSTGKASTSAEVTHRRLPGPIAVLRNVVRTSGLKGLWLGQTGTLIRETGGGVAWFTTKEFVARLLLARRPAPDGAVRDLAAWESAVSGACAGVMYNFALFPADTVKSTVQTEAELRPRAPGEPYPSFLATFRAMYKAQGVRGLYAGCGITVARAVPSSALIFIIYDGLSTRFG